VARSDPTGLIATAVTTLAVRSVKDALGQLARVIEEHKPAGIVVGYPVHASGDKTAKCEEIDRFIEKLASVFDGPIHTMDEQHSSVEAEEILHAHGQRVGKDKRRIDRLAAVIILQRYLDEHPRT
jgi:putative Holliday junction resolvase